MYWGNQLGTLKQAGQVGVLLDLRIQCCQRLAGLLTGIDPVKRWSCSHA